MLETLTTAALFLAACALLSPGLSRIWDGVDGEDRARKQAALTFTLIVLALATGALKIAADWYVVLYAAELVQDGHAGAPLVLDAIEAAASEAVASEAVGVSR